MSIKLLAVTVSALALAFGVSTQRPESIVGKDDGASSPMKTLNALVTDALARQHPEWEYLHFNVADVGHPQIIDAAVISEDRRIDLQIYMHPKEYTHRPGLVHVREASPGVVWVEIDGVGDECFGYDECDQAWLYVRRGSVDVAMYGRRNVPPAEQYHGPGKGCRTGRTEFSAALWELATALAPIIDAQLDAAELAHAAERAQRDRSVSP